MRDAHPLMKHRRIRATTRARRVGGGGRGARGRAFPPASMGAESVYRSPMNGFSMMVATFLSRVVGFPRAWAEGHAVHPPLPLPHPAVCGGGAPALGFL